MAKTKLEEEKVYSILDYSTSLRGVRAGSPVEQELKTEIMEECCLLACSQAYVQLSFSCCPDPHTQWYPSHLLSLYTLLHTHTPTSASNQENSPTVIPTDQSDSGNSLLRQPFPRYVKLTNKVSHHRDENYSTLSILEAERARERKVSRVRKYLQIYIFSDLHPASTFPNNPFSYECTNGLIHR